MTTKRIDLGLTLKAAAGRTFTGIATTPSPDRYGEIVLPKGAEFKLPIVLLAFHNTRSPVGSVTKATVTDAGIEVVCEFVPAGVDAEADRCYGLAKAGALTGLSVGFAPIETEMDAEGRVVHTKWDWVELSLVSVPANQDAGVLNVKEKDVPKPKQKEAEDLKEKDLDVEVEDEGQDEDEEVIESPKPKGKLKAIEAPAVHTKGERTYSLMRALGMATGDATEDVGYEREVSQELARKSHRKVQGLMIPFSAFRTKAHDAITSSPDTGKSTTGEDRRSDMFMMVDQFFRPSIATALGVTFTTCAEDRFVVPVSKKVLTAGFTARDAAVATSSDVEFTAFTLQPKTVGTSFEIERSLLRYGKHPMAEQILADQARSAVELAMDTAIVSGSGTGNNPLGFLGTGGATVAASITGAMSASNAYDHSRKIRNELEAYLQQPDPLAKWLLHPMHTAILKKTPAFSGAQTPLVANGSDQFADRTYLESYALPTPAGGPPTTTKGLYGRFDQMIAVLFGGGIEFAVNPFADSVWNKDAALVRVIGDFNTMTRDAKRVLKFDTETL